MKKILFLALFLAPNLAFAIKDVATSKVNFVYQLDSDTTIFEFSSSVPNICGSYLYRVKSPNDAVANRKFSLVLTAFTTDSNLSFHDREICEGDRSVVGWVKLTK